MKRALVAGAVCLVAAGSLVTVASAATLGGVSVSQLDTSQATPSPAFYLLDHFASTGTVPLNGTTLPLSPTGLPADLGHVNSPAWTASADWTINGDLAEARGTGTKVATFPFIAQNGYVAVNFDVFAFNAKAGLVVTYDPVAEAGVALTVHRAGSVWMIGIGTIEQGTFTETASAALPMASSDRPVAVELRATIANGVVTGSYDGVAYVSSPMGAGTAAGLISLTPNVAAAFHYVSAAKTP